MFPAARGAMAERARAAHMAGRVCVWISEGGGGERVGAYGGG